MKENKYYENIKQENQEILKLFTSLTKEQKIKIEGIMTGMRLESESNKNKAS